MTYLLVCNKSNTTSITIGAETVYPSRVHEFTSDLSGIRIAGLLVSV